MIHQEFCCWCFCLFVHERIMNMSYCTELSKCIGHSQRTSIREWSLSVVFIVMYCSSKTVFLPKYAFMKCGGHKSWGILQFRESLIDYPNLEHAFSSYIMSSILYKGILQVHFNNRSHSYLQYVYLHNHRNAKKGVFFLGGVVFLFLLLF